MEKIFDTIKKVARSIHLSSEEHDHLDRAVMSFVDSHPIKNTTHSHVMKYMPTIQATNPLFGFLSKKLAYAVLSIIIIVGAGAGTAYASNSALPGDMLYPVKVNFTEELQEALKLSDEAKARWATERINRRFNEVEQLLAVLDTIDPEILNKMQTHVEQYGSDTVRAAQALDGESIAEVLSQLRQATKFYTTILASVPENANNEKTGTALNAMLENVETTEKYTKRIALSFFADAKEGESDSQKTVGALQVTAPQTGTRLVTGVATTIAWQSVPNAKSYEVSLTHPSGVLIGLIHGQVRYTPDAPYQLETSVLWPANYYHGPAPRLETSTLAPGLYRVRVRAEDFNGNVFVGESANFSVVAPDEDRGILVIETVDQSGNVIYGSRAHVEGVLSSTQAYDASAEAQGLVVFNHLPPGTYTVEVVPPSSYYQARFSVYIEAGKTAHRTLRVGSKEEPLSQKYEDLDDFVSPTINIKVADVLPGTISARANAGQSVLFARASLRPDDGIMLHRLKFGCAGDSRALTGVTFVTSNGVSGQMDFRPTYGGFELEIASKDVDFKIGKDETVDVSLYLNIRNLDEALQMGAEFPRQISCGPQETLFASQRTGRPIQQKNFDINVLTAMRALKTTLVQE